MAVVREHVATKAPVGSKQLKARHGFDISSATIRNEMAYMERAGYLQQPHTSAGRIPTRDAYRIYVNEVRHDALPQHGTAEMVYDSECRRLRESPRVLMRTTSRSLAALTGYPSIVMSPAGKQQRFKDIRVSPVSSQNILLSYTTDIGKEVQQLLRSSQPLTARQIADLSRALRKLYRGRTVGDLATVTATDLAAAVADCDVPEPVIHALRRAVEAEDDREIYVEGTSYILDEPEFQRVNYLREFIETLDQHAALRETLLMTSNRSHVTVTIGDENRVSGIRRCSIVSRSYARDGSCAGGVAVLGPMCMDYVNVMSVVSFVAQKLDSTFAQDFNSEQ